MVNQYDVIKVNLNPVKGNEKEKYRPCVVVSDTDFNNKVNIVWVLPVTSREKRYPTDVIIETMDNNIHGVVDCSQMRALDLGSRSYKLEDKLQQSCKTKVIERIKAILSI